MHIALGRSTNRFPVEDFFLTNGRSAISVTTAPFPGVHATGTLDLAGDPGRRDGEWIIRDQYSNRHPAWLLSAGFPDTYDPANPPYILIFRVAGTFHVRFATEASIAALPSAASLRMTSVQKGVAIVSSALLDSFSVARRTLADAFEHQKAVAPIEPFDPHNMEDGRRQVFTAIMRRQGQQAFRASLLAAYRGRCAVTRSRTSWVLEAAHIVPYRGAKTNTVRNGLLLRADVHTLFDLGLISIEPRGRVVRVSSQLKGLEYASLEGKPLLRPKNPADWPATAALRHHYNLFQP
jgi:hypothetical protein